MEVLELIFGMSLSLVLIVIVVALPTFFLCRSHLGRIIEIVIAIVLAVSKEPIEEQFHAMRVAGFEEYFLFNLVDFTAVILLFIVPLIGGILFIIELVSLINLAMPYLPKSVRLVITVIGILLVALISFATVQLVGIIPVGYAISSAIKSWNSNKEN